MRKVLVVGGDRDQLAQFFCGRAVGFVLTEDCVVAVELEIDVNGVGVDSSVEDFEHASGEVLLGQGYQLGEPADDEAVPDATDDDGLVAHQAGTLQLEAVVLRRFVGRSADAHGALVDCFVDGVGGV